MYNSSSAVHTASAIDIQNSICDLGAEGRLLSCILQDPNQIKAVREMIEEEDFYTDTNRVMYSAFVGMHDKEMFDQDNDFDPYLFEQEIESAGNMSVFSNKTLFDCLADLNTIYAASSPRQAKRYAEVVAEKATNRRIREGSIRITSAIGEGDKEAAVALAEKIVQDAREKMAKSKKPRSVGGLIPSVMERITDAADGKVSYIPTGYAAIDKMIVGLEPSDFVLIAGRPGMGKSAFALDMAERIALRNNGVVLYFSLEMPAEQQVRRLLAKRAGINSNKLKTGQLTEEEWAMLYDAANSLSSLNMEIIDDPGIKPGFIEQTLRDSVKEHGSVAAVVIDYIQLVDGSDRRGNENEQMSYISKEIRKLSLRYSPAIFIATAQLNRAVEGRLDKRPSLSDLRGTGQFEQDATTILTLYRDDYYNEDSDQQNILEVGVVKSRDGGSGTASLFYRKELGLIRDLEIVRTEFSDPANYEDAE